MSAPHFETYQAFEQALNNAHPESVIPVYLEQLHQQVHPSLLNQALMASLDEKLLQEYQLIPLAFHQNRLYAASALQDQGLLEGLQPKLQCPMTVFPIALELFQAVKPYFTSHTTPAVPVEEPSVSDVFQRLLEKAQSLRASDIHLEPQGDQSVLVRFRIDGLLHDIDTLTASQFDYRTRLVSKIKVSADLDIAETRTPQDGRITESLRGEPVDLRVSTLPSMHGEKVVIRLLPHKNPFQELRDLGLEGEALLTYYNWIKKPQGMVLITGQTGSGKTSTLYTTLSHILHSEKNVVTIEDPIEYQLKGVTQVQVHPKVGLTFANGLRSILRQDPDTILLGEIRDTETAEIAYQAALTGHLVLSTLHTNDAPSAIIRLMDIHVEPYLISSATLGVVAQRLMRKVCPHCAEPYTPGQDLLRTLGLNPQAQEYLFYRAMGCEACFHTGYYGREGIFEVMPVDETLANLITQKEHLGQIRTHLQAQKVQSLYESALQKLAQGITTVEEIYRVVPPAQQSLSRTAFSGSVLVFMLFLLAILSMLILNASELFCGRASAFHIEREALQGTYAIDAALRLGETVIQERLEQRRLYFLSPNQTALENPLPLVPELNSVFERDTSVSLADSPITGHYRIMASPVTNTPVGQITYHYQIQGQATAPGSHESVAMAQAKEGHFQVETGTLPLSFFERYNAQGGLPQISDSRHEGPWYSQDASINTPPRYGHYSALTQSLSVPTSLWPILPGNSSSGSTLMITPLASQLGKPWMIGNEKPLPGTFQPETGSWALTVPGSVQHASLQALSSDIQQMDLVQFLTPLSAKDANGYQTLTVLKTLIRFEKQQKLVYLNQQRLQWTLNPAHQLVKQRLEKTWQQTIVDHFNGLVLIQGNLQQLNTPLGASTYSRPITLFVAGDMGITGSLTAHPQSPEALFGIVVPEGQLRFQPLQEPLLAEWVDKTNQRVLEGALAAAQFQEPESSVLVQIKGSVASLVGSFPERLETETDPRFYSLLKAPPFYPKLNANQQAVFVTQTPKARTWHWGEGTP